MVRRKRDIMQRFWEKVAIRDRGCWEWIATLDRYGYGQLTRDGKRIAVHRFIYEHRYGKIPIGLKIDHLCRNTKCVNPSHM